MNEKRFYSSPLGSELKQTSFARLADSMNSTVLVTDKEVDAFYFRALENGGILLNRAQIAAVRHFIGPLLTLAGAGSGKTSVLVARTGYLVTVKQVNPRNILLVTFTRKAAGEMKGRIARLPGLTEQMASQIQASTFHSFFLYLLKRSGYKQEILSNERYKQIIIKRILREIGQEDTYQPETILSILSLYKMNMVSMDDVPAKTKVEKELKQVFLLYEKWKKENNQLDFDDILVEAYHLIQESPSILQFLQDRFRYVMVDEFQDTNLLQFELIKMIVDKHHNLFVVGDDDQTIYSFNGASNQFILEFDKEFPESKIVTLDINYRSTSSILGLGNKVIKNNKHRKVKTLQATKKSIVTPKFSRPATSDEEAEWIVQSMKEKVSEGAKYSDIAILHRTTSYSRAIFEKLTLDEIPFIYYSMGDQLFYDQWPVKAVVSHLRLALKPRDFEAMEEVLSTLYINRGKGMEHINYQEQTKKKKYPMIHLTTLQGLKDFQVEKVKERIRFIKDLTEVNPFDAIKQIRSSFYDKFLETNDTQTMTLHKETIKETLDELESSAKRFTAIDDFVTFIDNMITKHQEMKELRKNTDADAISVMTIHRAKGLEFPIVYVNGASEGILPHITALEAGKMEGKNTKKDRREDILDALEEERRLCYVGITRAMDELIISSPVFYRGKKSEVSRFLLEAFSDEQKKPKANKNVVIEKVQYKKDKPKEIVLAWSCTSETCIAWTRIDSYQEAESKHKNCPICQSPMKKGQVEIY